MLPKISVIIPTFNRCESLRDTLNAVLQQKLASGIEFEIIAVNNNSSDRTSEVVREIALRNPSVREVFESKQGISAARNRGIKESKGELLIFTDDDVIPTEGWMEALWKALAEQNADCVSGSIEPIWEEEPPLWLRKPENFKLVSAIFALLDLGPKPFILKELDLNFLYGANMSFRKSVLEEVGGFREDLGLIGTKRSYGEDTEMIQRLFKAGKKMIHIPCAKVCHKVPTQRMNMNYIRKWRYDKALDAPPQGKKLPFWLIRECILNGLGALAAYAMGNQNLAIQKELFFWTQCGQIAGIFKR